MFVLLFPFLSVRFSKLVSLVRILLYHIYIVLIKMDYVSIVFLLMLLVVEAGIDVDLRMLRVVGMRGVAVALLHNAFKAPAAQFVMYLVLVALYARTRVLKMTGKKEYYREEKTE